MAFEYAAASAENKCFDMALNPMTGSIETKLEAFSALPIFPTMVWASQLRPDAAGRLNTAFMDQINRARQRQRELTPTGKWQTDQRLHTIPELAEFNDLVLGLARHVLDHDSIRYKGVEITGCWANIGFEGSRHRPHAHPNNFFSGVYYVNAPGGGNTINFFDPRPQAAVIVPPAERTSPMVGQKMTLDVKTGTLIMFPSWLLHSVDENRSSEERVSVAFNVMFTPYVVDMSPPNWRGNLQVTPE
jgi:uncharacterized protein (TIGR02466 family)